MTCHSCGCVSENDEDPVDTFVKGFRRKVKIVQSDPARYGLMVILMDNLEERCQKMKHGEIDYNLILSVMKDMVEGQK